MAGAHIEAAMLASSTHTHTVTFAGSNVDDDGVLRYRIMVFDGHNQWAVRRRYSEFLRVFDAVKDECSCPALPPKSEVRRRLSVSFCSQRYEGLESWLMAIVKLDPTLEASPELEAFLRPIAGLSDCDSCMGASRKRSLSSCLSSCSTRRPSLCSSGCSTESSRTWMGRSSMSSAVA